MVARARVDDRSVSLDVLGRQKEEASVESSSWVKERRNNVELEPLSSSPSLLRLSDREEPEIQSRTSSRLLCLLLPTSFEGD